jgi:GMP synthase (glutamine-hydrolysing)
MIDVVRFAPTGFSLPSGASVEGYDGIAWTGSNLTVHRDTPAVRDQLAFARAAFAAGTHQFGSCWAVHIAVTAAGGRCAANPKGREFGVSRTILLNDAGRAHPMFRGRRAGFDAFTSHEDHVVEVASNTTILAGNDFSEVQAVEVTLERGTFWAVQYHPEYELADVARLAVARSGQLTEQGFFADADDVDAYVSALETLAADPARTEIAFRHGVTRDVLDAERRTSEVARWLEWLPGASTSDGTEFSRAPG